VQVRADRDRLRQVAYNLLDNAIKYSPAQASIEVAVAEHEGSGCFSVSDTGPGIAPEHVERVFDRFYRVPGESSSTRGLGMSIVKSIVSAHGGEVSLYSQTGLGTSVRVCLTAADPTVD
jgi:signal transduction histidine kinase